MAAPERAEINNLQAGVDLVFCLTLFTSAFFSLALSVFSLSISPCLFFVFHPSRLNVFFFNLCFCWFSSLLFVSPSFFRQALSFYVFHSFCLSLSVFFICLSFRLSLSFFCFLCLSLSLLSPCLSFFFSFFFISCASHPLSLFFFAFFLSFFRSYCLPVCVSLSISPSVSPLLPFCLPLLPSSECSGT